MAVVTFTDAKKPFFLYLPFNHVHHPQFAGKKFTGSTLRGIFGDSLVREANRLTSVLLLGLLKQAELDWGVGQVLEILRKAGVERNTFVFFTSDNGYVLN